MSGSAAELSLLHSHIKARRFDDETIRILQSLLVTKDVKSLMQIRSSLTQLLRSESLSVIRSIAGHTVKEKLLILEFFVRAFATVGDVESCLALRYEALVMREVKAGSCQLLKVFCEEWLNFVEDALLDGFHSIAEKACENALLCFNKDSVIPESGRDSSSEHVEPIRKIMRLKHRAMRRVASHSVRVQAAEYLNKKTTDQSKSDLFLKDKRCLACTSFRNGIKKQNIRKLHESQSLLLSNDDLNEQQLNFWSI